MTNFCSLFFASALLLAPLAAAATNANQGHGHNNRTMNVHPITGSEIDPACFSETYEMSLANFHGHVYFTTLPLATSDCPPLVVNAGLTTRNGDGKPIESSVGVVMTIGPDLVDGIRGHGHFLGMNHLQSIYTAFVAAKGAAASNAEGDGLLDENNCSLLVVSILHRLGVEITDEIRTHLIEGLMHANESVMGMMEAAVQDQGNGVRGRLLRALLAGEDDTSSTTAEAVVDHNIAACAVSS